MEKLYFQINISFIILLLMNQLKDKNKSNKQLKINKKNNLKKQLKNKVNNKNKLHKAFQIIMKNKLQVKFVSYTIK